MLRTIIVDDEPYILEHTEIMLRERAEIEIVATYKDAIQALHDIPVLKPDCVFLDIEMAGINGIELANRLIAFLPELLIVFVTSHNHFASQAFDVKAADYLLKPVRPERLYHTVDRLLAKRPVTSDQPARQNECHIQCLDTFELSVNGASVKWSRSKARELLAYMLCYENKWISKHKLCDELWPDTTPERALSYLQICMHSLRKTLREAHCQQIEIKYASNRYIAIVRTEQWDVRQFDQAYERFLRTADAKDARAALALYEGNYLDSEDWSWSVLTREDYICKAENLKEALMLA